MDVNLANRAIDEINGILTIYNRGAPDLVGEPLADWCDQYCDPQSSLDPLLHSAALLAVTMALKINRGDLVARIHATIFDQQFDQMLRREVNDIIQLANEKDEKPWREAIRRHVQSHWTDNRIIPHSFDLIKAIRFNVLISGMLDLLPPIDTHYFKGIAFQTEKEPYVNGDLPLYVPGAEPIKLHSENDCKLSRDVARSGIFEPMSLELWAALSRDCDLILDIGANVGIFALVAAAAGSEAPIHAFEANPEAFVRLRQNVELNDRPQIVTHEKAVSNEAGVATFWYCPSKNIGQLDVVGSLQKPGYGCSEIEASTVSVDDMFMLMPGERLLIKIDTEGGELEVFDGMQTCLDTGDVDIVLESYKATACRKMTERLTPLGYRYYRILEGDHALQTLSELEAATFDWRHNFNTLATRRSPGELKAMLPAHCSIV